MTGCKVACNKVQAVPDGAARYRATITLPSRKPGRVWGSYCSFRADTKLEAYEGVFELAREPAPGFPGWIEPKAPVIKDIIKDLGR